MPSIDFLFRRRNLFVSSLVALSLIATHDSQAQQQSSASSEVAIAKQTKNTLIEDNSITVIADIHGDFPTMFELLSKAQIIDSDGNWIAGKRTLISTGDLIDRGPDSRQIIDFFMQLQQQATTVGGSFKMALGNHEVMNIRGDLRYVSKAEFAAFADDEPEGLREEVYRDYLRDSDLEDTEASKKKFLKLHPPGFFGHIEAYAPEGKYGHWLLQQNIIVKYQQKLFAHGGFSQPLVDTGKTVEQLNEQLMEDLKNYSQLWRELIKAGLFKYSYSKYDQKDVATALVNGKIKAPSLNKRSTVKKARKFVKLANSLLFSSFGPTWYRGNMYCHTFSEESTVNNVLNHFNAKQIFLGHTPDNSLKVRSRFNERVIMLDTGMSQAYYKGNPSAVIIGSEGTRVLNLNDEKNNRPIADPVRKPLYANGLSDNYLQEFYSNAKVVEEKALGDFYTKPIRLSFKLNDKKHRAIFKYLDTDKNLEDARWQKVGNYADRYIYDLAAYKLDRLLGLYMVPFVMPYQHNGKRGILQYWVEDSVSKTELITNKESLNGYCTEIAGRELMQIFDWLIYNEDRNTGNELYTEKNAQLWLIDHTRAFRVNNSLPNYDTDVFDRLIAPTTISASFKDSLNRLNKENLKQALGNYLHRKQIDSILKRRNLILELLSE